MCRGGAKLWEHVRAPRFVLSIPLRIPALISHSNCASGTKSRLPHARPGPIHPCQGFVTRDKVCARVRVSAHTNRVAGPVGVEQRSLRLSPRLALRLAGMRPSAVWIDWTGLQQQGVSDFC